MVDTLPARSSAPPCGPTAHPLVELFLATREERNCEPRTVAEHRRALERFFAAPGVPQDPRALTGDALTFFMAHLRREGTGPSGRETLQRRVLVFLTWLYDRGDIERDPRRGLARVQVPQRIQPQIDEETFAALLAAAADRPRTRQGNRITAENLYRNIAILRLLWATGLRRAELCSLDLEDVSLDRRELTVRYAKGKKSRRVPFDVPTKRALLEYFVEERDAFDTPSNALFLGRGGTRLRPAGLKMTLTRLARRAGVEAPSHAFRRGFARRMRRGGLDLGETGALLGHSTLKMVIHYAQEGETEAAIDAYRRVIG